MIPVVSQRIDRRRAVYYIFDLSDGKGYIGSASGAENLVGRWLNYGASGILRRFFPDLDAAYVIRLEATWQERLHTRQPWGLNEN